MSDSAHDRIVAAIGDQYEFEKELGRGGMSIVYRARDRRLDRLVAIKVLPPELSHDPAVRTRFAREAHTSAQLSHPHIVPIYDVGDRGGIAYLVMALVTGGNLAAHLAREPFPPVEEVRRILCEVADALGFAHLRGVIHRDIKPDNILIDGDSGRAMVTDFGIARAMEAGARLTATGIAVGTPTYMSPEQAVGERDVDGRSDVYSLGVVAYQMLTGRVPFSAANSMALLLKHVTESPRPIAEVRPDTPRPIREVVERALAKSPDDRWPTAEAMREALLSDDASGTWRWERREPVRYTSPNPDAPRRDRSARDRARAGTRSPSPRPGTPALHPRSASNARVSQSTIVIEPEHLASLTPDQRADLRLWHGRVNLLERIKAMRGYAVTTLAAIALGFSGFVVGASEGDAFPLVFLSPIIPFYMSRKLWLRGKSLKRAGLRLRRVLLMPRASWVLPAPSVAPGRKQLEKLAPAEILDGPYGDAIRRAAEDRAAILEIHGSLSKADRALLPDVAPTANALVERITHLAKAIDRLGYDIDPRLANDLDNRIAAMKRQDESTDRDRRLALLERQRATLEEMLQYRATLATQLESAGLALGTLKLDLIKLRSSGLESALSDVSTATQEARALSRDIGALLAAVAEVKSP